MSRRLNTSWAFLLFALLFGHQLKAQTSVNLDLIARTLGEKELSNGDIIRVFGFAENLSDHPNIPGPTIRAKEGDSVHIDLWNLSQGAAHTIHLHGLDVDQQNDGVPHLSFDIEHLEHGQYHFKAPHAGTYLYHCHVVSPIHVQAGMYGMVIISEKNGERKTWTGGHAFNKEFSFMMSEIDTAWHTDMVLDHDHDTAAHSAPIPLPVYTPQFFLVNGLSDQQITGSSEASVSAYQTVPNYIRFTNIGYNANKITLPAALSSRIIDSDGRPLPQEEVSDTLWVFPGERYGVLVESADPLFDQITVEYYDLHTMKWLNTQNIPVEIDGIDHVQELTPNQLKIDAFPNPFQDQITIEFELEKAGPVELSLVNAQGKVVLVKSLGSLPTGTHTQDLDTQALKPGNYLLKVRQENAKALFKSL